MAGLLALLFGAFWWNKRRSKSPRALASSQSVPAADGDTPDPSVATAGAAAGAASGAPVAPARVDVTVDIVNASRSIMMFTVEYRVNFANRSDRAVRDIAIEAQLTSAQRGGSITAPANAGQPVETIERIGPHQSRSVSGELQLPLIQINVLKQGQKPLFIPLLHLTVEGAGDETKNRTFAIGLPSGAAQARLHPIPLDTPPGGIPGLRSREIKLGA